MAYDVHITKDFQFDAAHCLPGFPPDHRYSRLHGHSFRVAVTIAGTPDTDHGWIADFAEIDTVLAEIRLVLDHHTLNDVPGLENPTLETIATWILERALPRLPGIAEVRIHRDSIGESCTVRRRG